MCDGQHSNHVPNFCVEKTFCNRSQYPKAQISYHERIRFHKPEYLTLKIENKQLLGGSVFIRR